MSIFQFFRSSARTLRETRTLAIMGLLTAMYVVLSFVAINPTSWLRITFGFLPLVIAGLLFGPVPAALAGGIGDILQYMIKPTGPYFPGFTLSAMLGGLIYGILLYRQQSNRLLFRMLISRLLVILFLNIVLNSIFLHMLYGSALVVWSRFAKSLIEFPVDVLLLYLLLQALPRVLPRGLLDEKKKM